MTLDLVGPSEIAQRLGTRPQTVSMWRQRHLLPEPEAVISRIPVWHWDVVKDWAIETGRLACDEKPAIDRAALRAEADRAAMTLATIGRVRSPRRDETGGEWDWWRALSGSERKRLQRRWVGPGGAAIDELCETIALHTLADPGDVESCALAWLGLTRIADGSASLASGRNARAVEGFSALPEQSEDTPARACYGTNPADMTYEQWLEEVERLEVKATEVIANATDGWIVGADEEVLLRLDELQPASVVGETRREVYRGVVALYRSVR